MNWKVAKYLRLSSEDRDAGGNLKSESESISGQRKLIDGYIKKTPAFQTAEVFEFCDDGYTGTNFDRPAMQKLLTAAQTGEINCIVVKDLSRFGRSYIEVGNFLEKVLPFLGVRFISVNDAYDSQNPRCIGGLDTAFKNLLNDLYSRDCSAKIKSGKHTAALQGKYQNPWAPFGYVKSVTERAKLDVDAQAAAIVRRIFALFLEGRGTVEVARTLNHDNVPTKSAYRTMQGDKMRWQYVGEQNNWNAASVRSILTDKRYIGSVVYGKRKAKGVAAHRNIKVPQEKFVEVENCHQALVSKEDFEQVQAMLRKGKSYGKSERPLAGKIKCGVCGHAMPLRKGKELYFTCGSKWYDSECACGDFRVGQRELYEVLEAALQKEIDLRVEQEALRKVETEKVQRQQGALEEKLAQLERELAQSKGEMRVQFEQYATGLLVAEDFAAFQHCNKVKIAQLEQEIFTAKSQIAELLEKGTDVDCISLTGCMMHVIMTKNGMNISLEMLDMLIREVRLYPDRAMVVSWMFDGH